MIVKAMGKNVKVGQRVCFMYNSTRKNPARLREGIVQEIGSTYVTLKHRGLYRRYRFDRIFTPEICILD